MSRSRLSPVFEVLDRAVAEGLAPGAVLAAGSSEAGSFRHVTGHAALLPAPRPMRETTLFDLASLTKVLATTWLTMAWWERGRLDLDAPLDRLLPGYYPPDKRSLTVRQLLCHAAGLPSGVRLRQQTDPRRDAPLSRPEVMARFLDAPLEAEPGTRTLYSDVGPILVADLLEQLGGQRLDQACAADLFEPAGLTETFFVCLDDPPRRRPRDFAATEDCPWRGRVVTGEVHDENAWLLRGVAGHAGLFAPVADLERVAAAYLGLAGDARVRPETLAALTARQHSAPDSRRALGWDTPTPAGPGGKRLSSRAYGHTGFTGTSLWIDPDAGLYVILLTNRVHPTRDNDRLLSFRPRLHDLVVEALGVNG